MGKEKKKKFYVITFYSDVTKKERAIAHFGVNKDNGYETAENIKIYGNLDNADPSYVMKVYYASGKTPEEAYEHIINVASEYGKHGRNSGYFVVYEVEGSPINWSVESKRRKIYESDYHLMEDASPRELKDLINNINSLYSNYKKEKKKTA